MIYVQHLHKQVHSMHFHYKSRFITNVRSDLLSCFIHMTLHTQSIPELIWVKNVRAILACGFLMKFLKKTYPENLKKIMGAVWELPAK